VTDSPTVDGRDREELLSGLQERALTYTDKWDPSSDDSGTTLLYLFSRFGMDVINRLNDVPYKHRAAFLDALDFERRPPQSARIPLTFTTTADIETNIVVPEGTQAIAQTDDGSSVVFEIKQDDGFEATPATLDTVYSVDPDENSVYEHSEVSYGQSTSRLFSGNDRQAHRVYFGHEGLLNVAGDSTATLRLWTTGAETLDERVRWEYYGEDEHGEGGWKPLERERPEAVEEPINDVGLGEKMQRVSDRVQYHGSDDGGDEEQQKFQFRFPEPTAETEIDGYESYWIRGTVPGDQPQDFDVEIESARIDVGNIRESDTGDRRRPAMALSNDVPLSFDEDVYPFGPRPSSPASLYLSSEEAFTKKGGTVDVWFEPPDEEQTQEREEPSLGDEDITDDEDDDVLIGQRAIDWRNPYGGAPYLSWEYWNGDGWTNLPLEDDDTDSLRSPGTVSFTVPGDLEATSVSGHEDYWIRARLANGSYSSQRYEESEDGGAVQLVREFEPPVFGDITLQYRHHGVPFDQVISYNNTTYRVAFAAETTGETRGTGEPLTVETDNRLVPFIQLPDEEQALYLAFDAPLRDGPINFHVPMEDKPYPREFEPGIRWEYCVDPERWNWEKLDVYDGTEGFTERGIVSINFPTPTEAFEHFDRRRHWIRARVTRDQFITDPQPELTTLDRRGTEPLGKTDQGVPTPPTVEGITPNTQWAFNERTVTEVIGGSDGSPDQSFSFDNAPVTDAEVWVDEAGALSASQKRDLEESSPDEVRRESNGSGESFWVRWTEVSDFLESGTDSRHYRLDRTNGTIAFGDSQNGAIPPTGEENIEAVYGTGGGSQGNVDAGSVSDLRNPISRIDNVINLRPSDGGTDIEPFESALSRAPKQIKNRGRAVSPDDFEQVAKEASRQLAKVKCEPGMDGTGADKPGWITLLVIPRERRDKPIPSLELRQRVQSAVRERAPVTLVAHDTKQIVVRGPEYADVSVETTVETRGVESVTNLKNTIERTLGEYFHPLSGGGDGDGWEFGTAPRIARVTTLIEETEGVDRVQDIRMRIERTSDEQIVRAPGTVVALARDEIVTNGTHDVNVIMRSQR